MTCQSLIKACLNEFLSQPETSTLHFLKSIREASPRKGTFHLTALLLVQNPVRMGMGKTLMKIMSQVINKV